MKINWFPGHMTKALRQMEKEIKNIDFIIYVLDARAPLACLNPSFNSLIANKPVLVILNKIDMADSSKIDSVKRVLKQSFASEIEILELNSTASGALKNVLLKVNRLCAAKIQRYADKDMNAFLRGMVIGVPNSGKSTLVNNLCGKAKTITGNRPGVTRGKQWVTISKNIQILDTPGTLYPNLENERHARFLAYIGSIRDEVLDISELACDFVRDIEEVYPDSLNVRYAVELEGETFEKVEQIARKKGFALKGGDVDYERAANMILDDFRKGRLGEITLI